MYQELYVNICLYIEAQRGMRWTDIRAANDNNFPEFFLLVELLLLLLDAISFIKPII